MRHTNVVAAPRNGFTLLEILVALVLIGLLVGALVPSVLNQVSKGEVNRVAEDIGTIGDAAKTFRVDVNRWPGDLEDLVIAISSTDTDLDNSAYPAGLQSRWAGPYIEQGEILGDTLVTAGGGVIRTDFERAAWGSEDFLRLQVTGLSASTVDDVDLAVDGEANIAQGSIRASASRDTLYFYATPVK